ncbi:MAG: phenylalanine--tRNA ligase subunit beta [Gammaproteobacteria bacterium]|nr:phenylalanine--tRNA ligase subunit beta [Gammaproteobacteria bacterium]
MKVSVQWLREWISSDLTTQEIAARLTMIGLEVDQVYPVAAEFSGVVVARVIETKPHPEADKLTLCQVDAGDAAPLSIVCGAANVRAGLKVALATLGATLPNGMTIKPVKLRGQPSEGMLCSFQELGMTDTADGIMELEQDAPVGMNLRDYLGLDDEVLEISLTPNRGDCLSVAGVARELGAKLSTSVSDVEVKSVSASIDQTIEIKVEAVDACPLYTGRVLTELKPGAVTPVWMQERLRRAGIRPVHVVVDVTQYVMLELGQPMHAFDAEKIDGGLVVRQALPQEKLTLLDGQCVELSSSALVIASKQGAVALAGIMGGQDSAVSDETTSVFLESAFFTPHSIMGVARLYGLVSDASYRFERGVDPTLPLRALERVSALLQEITHCKLGPVITIKQKESPWFQPKEVLFNPDSVERRIGLKVPESSVLQILASLGFNVSQQNPSAWRLTVPSYRFDIAIEEDVIEEIIRIYGYDKLPIGQIQAPLRVGTCDPLGVLEDRVVNCFASLGYRQCMNYAFVDPQLQSLLFPERAGLMLANPLSPELSQMRTSLWPGLLAAMSYNLNRQHEAIALFETGRVFDVSSETLKEIPMVAAVLTGSKGVFEWGSDTRSFDFFDLKGAVEALLKTFSVDTLSFEAATHVTLHPGKTAQLVLDGEVIGYCGVLHPRIAQMLDVTTEVMLFECQQSALLKKTVKPYRETSKFPQIRRDLALIVDKQVAFAEIEAVIRSIDHQDKLKAIHVFDVYTGEPIPKDKKSIAIALLMQSQVKTLNEPEVNAYISAIIEALDKKLSCILRDGTS